MFSLPELPFSFETLEEDIKINLLVSKEFSLGIDIANDYHAKY